MPIQHALLADICIGLFQGRTLYMYKCIILCMNNAHTVTVTNSVCTGKRIGETPDLGHMYMYIHKLLITTCTQECTIMCRGLIATCRWCSLNRMQQHIINDSYVLYY